MDNSFQEMNIFVNGMYGFLHRRLHVHIPIPVIPVHNVKPPVFPEKLIGLPQSIGSKASVIFRINHFTFPFEQVPHIIVVSHANGIAQQKYLFHSCNPFHEMD